MQNVNGWLVFDLSNRADQRRLAGALEAGQFEIIHMGRVDCEEDAVGLVRLLEPGQGVGALLWAASAKVLRRSITRGPIARTMRRPGVSAAMAARLV